jgi:hypothetical protein
MEFCGFWHESECNEGSRQQEGNLHARPQTENGRTRIKETMDVDTSLWIQRLIDDWEGLRSKQPFFVIGIWMAKAGQKLPD